MTWNDLEAVARRQEESYAVSGRSSRTLERRSDASEATSGNDVPRSSANHSAGAHRASFVHSAVESGESPSSSVAGSSASESDSNEQSGQDVVTSAADGDSPDWRGNCATDESNPSQLWTLTSITSTPTTQLEEGSSRSDTLPSSPDGNVTAQDISNDEKFKSCSKLDRSKQRRFLLLAAAVLLVIGAVIGVCVALLPSDTPSDEGGPSRPSQDALYQVRTHVLKQDWSDSLSLLDPTSAQSMAVEQLALEGADLNTIEQRYAILVVFFGLGGDASDINGQDECDWGGVIDCDSLKRVQKLTLTSKGLSGSIPEEIGMLTDLGKSFIQHVLWTSQSRKLLTTPCTVHLELFDNDIRGTIPTSLYNLRKLSKCRRRYRRIVICSFLSN